MKRWAYCERREGQVVVDTLYPGGTGEVAHAGAFDAALLSRRDFQFAVFHVPNLQERQLRNVLRYRIRSVYPGNPDETVFEYELSPDRKKAAVTMTKKDHLTAIRESVGETPLFLPWHIIRSSAAFRKRGKSHGLFFHASWIESIFTENGFPLESTVVSRGSPEEEEPVLRKALKTVQSGTTAFIIAPGSQAETLREKISKIVPDGTEINVLALERLLDSPASLRFPAFHTKKKIRVPPFGVRILILLSLITLSVFGYLAKKATAYDARLKSLSAQYALLERETQDGSELEREISELEKRYSGFKNDWQPDVYGLFSALKDAFDPDTLIISFSLRGRNFQCEGSAVNPFSLVEKFSSKPELFENVAVVRVSPLPDSDRESFILSGTYRGR